MIVLFFIYHGRKIAPVLYICPSTGTENNTERKDSAQNDLLCVEWDIKLYLLTYSNISSGNDKLLNFQHSTKFVTFDLVWPNYDTYSYLLPTAM